MSRGYFGIGIYHAKKDSNWGTLFRHAHSFGASFVFTIAPKFPGKQSSDMRAWRHIPWFNFPDMPAFQRDAPTASTICVIEDLENSVPLPDYTHPERCIYILGNEAYGFGKEENIPLHWDRVFIPGGKVCLNVSVAGSIVMYDRLQKLQKGAVPA